MCKLSRRNWLAIGTFLVIALLGGQIVILVASPKENELVTHHNFDRIAWKGMKREEIDGILGPPASIRNDEEIRGVRVVKLSDGSVLFVPSPCDPCWEVRTYIGKPDKWYNRLVVKVGFSKDKPEAEVECCELSPTAIGKVLGAIKDKLRL